MKRVLGLVISTLVVSTTIGQEHNGCGFDAHQEQLFNENPGSKQAFHEYMVRQSTGSHSGADRAASLTVPVVVHVLHNGGSSNISYEQILSAIDMINADFQLLNPDSVDVRNTAEAPFQPLTANMGIEFKLAKIDPEGNCTNGVERRLTASSSGANDDNAKHYDAGGLDAWPRDDYFNIWVVSTIESQSGGTTLGYAQFPQAFAGDADEYGIVIRHDRMGSIGTATSGDRTLTHEIGHCFGLLHTFQGGCNEDGIFGGATNDCQQGGDYICDTPPVSAAQWSCVATQETCLGTIPANDYYGIDVLDQFENFMSYSPCQYMFTEGQKVSVLDNFGTITHMSNLTSAANLVQTGVNLPEALCEAQFTSTNTAICAGSTVDFSDLSFFSVSGRTWTFGGGTPATSPDSAVTVTYNTPGTYDVTLEVTDGSGTEIITETAYITVLSSPGEPLPYHEGFEFYTAIPDNTNWFSENEDGAETWELTSDDQYSGGWSVKLNNFGVTNGSKDALISDPIDLSGVSASDIINFTFEYAYHRVDASNNEKLKIYISNDCGESWVLRKAISGSSLSQEIQTDAYSPEEGDWTHVAVTNITSSYYVQNLRIKFEFENDSGNNFYLDHINLSSGAMASINSSIADNLSVYPNPVNGNMRVKMDVYDAAPYNVTLTNMVGQTVANVYSGLMSAGEQQINYDLSDIPAGVYLLNIESNGMTKSTKLIKQ
jgi:PKD repeat protein